MTDVARLSPDLRRRVTLGLAAAQAAVAVVALAGIAGGVGDRSAPRIEATGPTIPVPRRTSRPLPPVDLAAAITPAPPGYQQIPDKDLKVVGRVDLETLVQERENPAAARELLEELGFTEAFVRSWERPDNRDRITIRLYQFSDAEGAARYARSGSRTADRTVALPGTTEAVAAPFGLVDGKERVFVFGSRGRVAVVVAADLTPPLPIDDLATITRSQLALLPRP